ncbi:MAG: GNAT family N-acetyltransferase [Phycisphaerales bacterium]|nr:GNAT family N-acetyltransferase [Phycisphaerales bacterium]
MTTPQQPAPWTPPSPPPVRFESPRFTIRAYEPSDAPALFHAIDAFRESYVPWLPWARSQHKTIADSAACIDRFRASMANPLAPENNAVFGFVYGVFDKASGELIAGTGFNRLAPEWHNAETGYWVRPDRRRQGIATEVLARTISIGFAPQCQGGFGFRRIHIFAAAANTASRGVPARLGLRQIMHARQDRWLEGLGWSDSIGWDVLADEWDLSRSRLRA